MITYRKYKDKSDFERICKFLEETSYSEEMRFDNNITLFEFQTALSCGDGEENKEIDEALSSVFLWFDNEELVGMLQDDIFCIAHDYRFIFDDMVSIKERLETNEERYLEWNIYEGNSYFENILNSKGYYKTEEYWVRRDIDLNTIDYSPSLPDGFYVESVPNLGEHDGVCMAYKLCYGILFNKNILDNFYKTSTYRKELDLVVVGEDNKVIALCSSRFDEKNKIVSIEAVSCYHEYRNKGISKELLGYALNASKKLGANKATVYTAMPEKYPAPNKLYESVGFKIVGKQYVWKKTNKSTL